MIKEGVLSTGNLPGLSTADAPCGCMFMTCGGGDSRSRKLHICFSKGSQSGYSHGVNLGRQVRTARERPSHWDHPLQLPGEVRHCDRKSWRDETQATETSSKEW